VSHPLPRLAAAPAAEATTPPTLRRSQSVAQERTVQPSLPPDLFGGLVSALAASLVAEYRARHTQPAPGESP